VVDVRVKRKLWRNATIATFDPASPYGLRANAALITHGETIEWLGDAQKLPVRQIDEEFDCQGACITPRLIDCHTHLIYAGNRAHEFELRLQGASYETIAKAGGGIAYTVEQTRAASDDELLNLAIHRAKALINEGVGTIEIKSGYGLTQHDELRSLRMARALERHLPIRVKTTYLAAHAVPPEFRGDADGYIDAVCHWMRVGHAEGLIDAADAFCETIGFTNAQTERVFACAQSLGLPVKLHAEQLSDMGGAALAAQYRALSADHLEYLSNDGIAALRASGTVAVLLPAAFYFLRETKLPPVQALREAGVPIALGTDHNPGSSPILSPLLTMNMACTLFKLTPEEAWRGFTVNAAGALGLPAETGMLRAGLPANFVMWNAAHPRDLVYPIGGAGAMCALVVGGNTLE
jgi:imidazolonepropionase